MVNTNCIKSFFYQRSFRLSIYLWPIKFLEIIIRYSCHEKIIWVYDQRLKKLPETTSPSEPFGCQGLSQNEVEYS